MHVMLSLHVRQLTLTSDLLTSSSTTDYTSHGNLCSNFEISSVKGRYRTDGDQCLMPFPYVAGA